jgi:hypothetical protein
MEAASMRKKGSKPRRVVRLRDLDHSKAVVLIAFLIFIYVVRLSLVYGPFFESRQCLADDTGNVHTPTMTLKNAALLALIGTVLITALLVLTFVFNVLNTLRGLVPAVILFSSFIYAFACFSVAVFFYVFHRAQS